MSNDASTQAEAINNAGDIVGVYNVGAATHGFLLSGGVYTTLDNPLATGGTFAYGINDAGQIAGTYINASGTHGFLYSMGNWTTLDAPGSSFTTLSDINNHGDITGVYLDAGGDARGAVYSNGTWTTVDAPAGGINDAGQIVGMYGNGHGFIGTPDNVAPAITSNGGGATAALSFAATTS